VIGGYAAWRELRQSSGACLLNQKPKPT
jgi:hypothetical protein